MNEYPHMFRGQMVDDIPTEDVRVGDKLCCWLSDGSAYPTVTGWTDRELSNVPSKPVQRTFTVTGDTPWWVDELDTTSTLGTSTFILARDN